MERNGGGRAEPLAPPPRPGRPGPQEERDVGAHRERHLGEQPPVPDPPCAGQATEDGRRIRAPAPEPGHHRDALPDPDGDPFAPPQASPEGLGGAGGQVSRARRDRGGPGTGRSPAPVRRAPGPPPRRRGRGGPSGSRDRGSRPRGAGRRAGPGSPWRARRRGGESRSDRIARGRLPARSPATTLRAHARRLARPPPPGRRRGRGAPDRRAAAGPGGADRPGHHPRLRRAPAGARRRAQGGAGLPGRPDARHRPPRRPRLRRALLLRGGADERLDRPDERPHPPHRGQGRDPGRGHRRHRAHHAVAHRAAPGAPARPASPSVHFW